MTMAVRANDIALRYFLEDLSVTGAPDHARDHVALGGRVTVIEFHRKWWESTTAISARHVPQRVQHLCLTLRHREFLESPRR